jgi:putative ABC transport system permease protein
MSLALIGLRSLVRNKFRMTLTVLASMTAVLTFITMRTVLVAWNASIEYAAKDRIIATNKMSLTLPLPKRYIEAVRNARGVTKACYQSWFGGKDPKSPKNMFRSFAMDATCLDVYDERVITPEQKEAWLADRKGAILGDLLARKLGVQVGDRINLKGTVYPGDWQFNVSAIYTTRLPSTDRSQFLFHWDYLNDSISADQKEQITWMAAKIDNPERSAEIAAQVESLFEEKDIQTSTMSERTMSIALMSQLDGVLAALSGVSLIILFIMTMILGNTIAMSVRERTREYGVLRALGFLPKHIVRLVLIESLLLGAVTAALGVGLAYPLIERGLGRFLTENAGNVFPQFKISPTTVLVAACAAIALSISAALIPALRASRLSVLDALRRTA